MVLAINKWTHLWFTVCMEKLGYIDENQLIELWQQLQSMTQEETRDCGDVALLWHLAERLAWSGVNMVGNDSYNALIPFP